MKYCKQFGFAQIFVLAGMLLVSAALPVATKLLQQNQENRSNAAAACSSYNNKPSACSSAGCSYETLIKSCSPKITKKTTTKTCTYNCTAWTTCNSSGKQTCKAQTKPQPGCTGGTTKIGTTQNCTPAKTTTTKTTPKTCTSFTYTDWTPASCPSSGRQTRTVKTSSPSGCTGGTRVTSRNCSPPTPTKSATKTTCSYICTKWGSCSSGWQTCTTDSKLSTSQPNCTGGRKIGTRQKCTPATSSSNTTTKKADGSTCSYNSECTSGYCNLTIKKCATKVTKTTTATDTTKTTTKTTSTTKDCVCSTTAGKCDLGSPAWKDQNGTSGSYIWSCTGSNCNPKNCSTKKTTDVTKTYYLYDGSKCTPTTSLSICQTTTCYSSLAACQLGNNKLIYYYYSDTCKSAGSYIFQSACQTDHGGATCYSSLTACQLGNPAKTTTITSCSSSVCGKCDSTNCGKGNDCLWGYNGSSTMYCYPKTAAIPVTDKCVVDGKTWNNNAAICSNNIAYICKSGVTRKVEDCGTRGCDVDGTCKEAVCSVSNCGSCVLPSACSSAGCYWEPLTKTCSKVNVSCKSQGGSCYGNYITCKSEGGVIVNSTDCSSGSVCCQIKDKNKIDGACSNFTGTEIPALTNKLCDNGNFSFTSYSGSTFSWQCLGLYGGKDANCLANNIQSVKTICDGKPIGEKKCQTPYIVLTCTSSGWEFGYCDEYSGEYCLSNKCQKIALPQKEGDQCISGGDIAYSCPDLLTCVNGQCTTYEKAENIFKKQTSCIATPYNLNYIYDPNTACPKGLSCNRRTGLCETPEKLIFKKAANDFCTTDSDCQSGFCMPITSDINALMTCSDVPEKEYIDTGNRNGAIVAGVVFAPLAALGASEVITASGLASAITTLYGSASVAATTAVTNFINSHPDFLYKIQKIGNVADTIEILAGGIACIQNPSSIWCQNLREDMANPNSGLSSSIGDIVSDLGGLVKTVNTAESAAVVGKTLNSGVETLSSNIDDFAEVKRVLDYWNYEKDIDIWDYPDLAREVILEAFPNASVGRNKGSFSIPIIDSENQVFIKLFSNHDPNSIRQLELYRQNPEVLDFIGSLPYDRGYVMKLYDPSTPLFSYRYKLTTTQINDLLADLKQKQTILGVPHGDLVREGGSPYYLNGGNILVQSLPNGEKQLRLVDYWGWNSALIRLSPAKIAQKSTEEIDSLERKLLEFNKYIDKGKDVRKMFGKLF